MSIAIKQLVPTSVAAVVMSLGVAASPLHAQDKAQTASAGAKDSAFVQEAASGGLMEVQLGQLAQQKASNKDVKNFGHLMETDHSKANEQLAAAAKQDGITVPTTLAAKHQESVDQLSKLSGKDFDNAYITLMVKDHTEDVEKFQQEAQSGQSAAVKSFAATTLPILQEHLSSAKSVAGRIGADVAGAAEMPADSSKGAMRRDSSSSQSPTPSTGSQSDSTGNGR